MQEYNVVRSTLILFSSCYWCQLRCMSTYSMASSASGQYAANSVFWLAARAGKMERYCPPGTARFVPASKISPKFKQVHENFLSPKLLSAKKVSILTLQHFVFTMKMQLAEFGIGQSWTNAGPREELTFLEFVGLHWHTLLTWPRNLLVPMKHKTVMLS